MIIRPTLHRSIPACAGEPSSSPRRLHCARVHPRLRGGATVNDADGMVANGPSPPARGSRRKASPAALRRGSIPACAGEPPARNTAASTARVHPRLRGGAAHRLDASATSEGPSPPARGSHLADRGQVARGGSIPACAGEPRGGRRGAGAARVHPRLRGGAPGVSRELRGLLGPSPPARGSPQPGTVAPRVLGSIPACAGEPL